MALTVLGLGLLLVIGSVAAAWAIRSQVAGVQATGSGGIGAVSFGVAEGLVEAVIVLFLALVIWKVVRMFRRPARP